MEIYHFSKKKKVHVMNKLAAEMLNSIDCIMNIYMYSKTILDGIFFFCTISFVHMFCVKCLHVLTLCSRYINLFAFVHIYLVSAHWHYIGLVIIVYYQILNILFYRCTHIHHKKQSQWVHITFKFFLFCFWKHYFALILVEVFFFFVGNIFIFRN